MVLNNQLPKKAIAESVQDQEPADLSALSNGIFYFGMLDRAASWINPWGSARRQWQLRRLFYDMHNTLIVGALSNMIARIQQTPTELSGGPRKTRYFNSLFQFAQFGGGWDEFLAPVLQDYLTIDQGAFIEVIAPGASDKAISQQVVGVAHLDSLRCFPTGNPDFPVYYRSHRTNTLHKLHWTRVVRLVDLPSPDPAYKGMGLSALSRALAVSQIQIMMSKYQVENLDDLPQKGIVTVGGLTKTQWEQALGTYNAEQKRDGNDVLRQLMVLLGVDPEHPPTINVTPFSTLPEHFDYEKAMRIHVNLLALAIGDDPQNISPLSGQAMGTATQSLVLHYKGQGKTEGSIRTKLTRTFNIAVLPPDLELKFKPKDTEQGKANAETAKFWTDVAIGMKNAGVSQEQVLQLLANTIPEAADVLLDEAGNLRLTSDDVKPETTATDDATLTPEAQQPGESAVQIETREHATKNLNSLQTDYEAAIKDLLGATQDDMSRRRAGIVMRAQIARYKRLVFDEGLKRGGVDPADKSDDDLALLDLTITEQSGYVTDMLNRAFADGLTPEMIGAKANMWWNKSIYPSYTDGLMSSDRNGYYEWVYGDTEHCDDCRALNGQIHRLKDYTSRGWLPKASKLKCKGFQCACELKRRVGVRARGNYA